MARFGDENDPPALPAARQPAAAPVAPTGATRFGDPADQTATTASPQPIPQQSGPPQPAPPKAAELIPGRLPGPEDVIPPLANFALYPARALAADLYAGTDIAKRQLTGTGMPGTGPQPDWWKTKGAVLKATEIPETPVGQTISEALDFPGAFVGRVVGGLSNALIGKERTQQLSPFVSTAVDVASPFLGGRMLRKAGEPTPSLPAKLAQTPETEAADILSTAIGAEEKYGGPSTTDIITRVNKANAEGKPLTMADVGGENVKSLAGVVTRRPGASRVQARDFLEARDKAAAQRLTQDIEQYVSSGPSALQATEGLLQTRSKAARPLYQRAEALQGIWSPRLQEFIENGDVRRGLSRGFRLERLDALAEGRPFNPTQLGVDLDIDGNIVLKKVPNLRVLDMGKRGLDAMIADERDTLTGRLSALGVELNKVRAAYIQEIDSLDTSGIYRAAREAWAGPSQSLDAVRWGRTVFNRSPEETARDFAKLSPSNQEFVRLGVADVLRERIAKTGFTGNEAKAIIKNAWTHDQLKAIFPDDAAFTRFADAVSDENAMAETTNRLTRGSATAERLAEDVGVGADVTHSAASAVYHFIKGNFPLALIHSWRVQRRLAKGRVEDEALTEAVAKIIFNPAIDLSNPVTQRMIQGPPPFQTKLARGGFRAARTARQANIFGPSAAQPGLTSPDETLKSVPQQR